MNTRPHNCTEGNNDRHNAHSPSSIRSSAVCDDCHQPSSARVRAASIVPKHLKTGRKGGSSLSEAL